MNVYVATFITHNGESYVPEDFEARPYQSGDRAYGYNTPDPNGDGSTVVITGTDLCDLRLKWTRFAQCCTRIRGADDDHYDYFPSAFDGLVDLANQIDELVDDTWCIDMACAIWDDHAYDNWAHNFVNKESLEFAAEDFANEIVARPRELL